ncbi:hypothetical protein QCA50_000557 [Cerrena zonata]|uniref:Uncharacterized protein n=1 Tax=Cerrena zonata TaxID=2478898 RepID=A0AAW0GR85_9APHY
MMDNAAPHEHDMTIIIKSEEQPEESFLHASTPPATIPRDADMPPSPGERTPTPPPRIDLGGDEDEEEQKPKPILKLSYEGFNVNGKCLCVIVEPYPPLPAVRHFVPSGGAAQRARTPLFLPGYDDERDRSETPAPFAGPQRNLPPVPLFLDDPEDNEDDDDGIRWRHVRS